MNEWEIAQRRAKVYQELYPVGTRIELISMEDPYAPITAGTQGTVVCVDDMGTIHMQWDNGRTLGIIPGVDAFRKIEEVKM